MEEKILKLYLCLLLPLVFLQCTRNTSNPVSSGIEKAVELTKHNKSINDTLLKYSTQDIKFMPCHILEKDGYRILMFQVIQPVSGKTTAIKIDRPYKIENIHGIDIFFSSVFLDSSNSHSNIDIDKKAKELISAGYLTIDGRTPSIHGESIEFVFCKNNDSIYNVLSTTFLGKKEREARYNNAPFFVESYYPKCH